MNTIKTFVVISALSVLSFSSFAQTISVTAGNIDDAETQIASTAKQHGADYKIIAAAGQNQIHMIAELTK